MKKKEWWGLAVVLILAGIISSCHITDQELGEDLLPPGDDVFLYNDTIFDIHAYPVTSTHVETSDSELDPAKIYLVGNWQDTIVGSAVASMITQINTNLGFVSGPNMQIDSLMLFVYVNDYVGNMDEKITFSVYEFTERIYKDSSYYSDFNPEGKYNPVPLAVKEFMPQDQDTLDFLITNQDFIDKFLALEDSTLTRSDSIFKDFFNGLYITAESSAPGGAVARVQPASDYTLLSLKYANDSTDVDTTAGPDFRWSQFTIDEFYCQKINMFNHDFSGTYLSTVIDNDSAEVPYCYVQGMSGVNTRFSFSGLEEWMAMNPVVISKASLVFDVVPEEEGGIPIAEMPSRLMMGTILEDGTYQPIYDYVVQLDNSNNAAFGGYLRTVSNGMFADTTYTYRFNITLHFQSMVDGTKTDNDFILKTSDGRISPRITKLWGNLPGNNHRIRLEIAYLKL